MTKLPFNLIVVDVETSGKPDNRIVEIGAVRLTEDLQMADEFSMLVDGRPLSEEVIAIHGITNEMLEGHPKFEQMWKLWVDWCNQFKPYVLGTWSEFDSTTFRDEYRRIDVRYPHPGHALDIKSVVWWECLRAGYYSRTLPVDRALSILGIPFDGVRHRGLADAKMEARLFQHVATQRSLTIGI